MKTIKSEIIKKIKLSIDNNNIFDYVSSELLTEFGLCSIVYHRKIWIYQIFQKKFTRS